MRKPEQFLIAVAAFAVVHAAWGLSGLPECGKADAPQCNGECPSGTRCTQVVDFEFILVRIFNESASGPQQGRNPEEPTCACLEVPCGGVPLEDGQACCNGVVTNASEDCFCSDDENRYACCYNAVNGSQTDIHQAAYTYNLPLDCCAGTTCGGTCVGAECAASDCCVCEPFAGLPTPACAAADSDVGCVAACFFSPEGVGSFPIPELGIGNESGVRIENGTCGEEGCIPPTARAPAASSTGLAVSIVCLAAIGVLALLRRRGWQR
jgi:hypothetical protein